ncbi:MAG: uracil-DNA glycosylase [Nitrospiria bacterium]
MGASPLKIKALIKALASAKPPGLFNPWAQHSGDDLFAEAHLLRQRRLFQHWSAPEPRLVLIGEAAGYQGCRYSGMPFTSERLILEGKIPRIEAGLAVRISSRNRPWSEPSATIVWNTLDGLGVAESTVLFNAVPWHPEGKKGPASNRTPTAAEKAVGAPYLKQFISLFPNLPVAALGNIASDTLRALKISHTKVRHPAYGGAAKFREGLVTLMNHPSQGNGVQ